MNETLPSIDVVRTGPEIEMKLFRVLTDLVRIELEL